MPYDNDLVVGKLRRWETYLERYRLPDWEEIPDLGLYMDQVVQYLRQTLSYLPPELKQTQVITAAAINNYVRTRLLPEPQKKKYYRTHIAQLLMIVTLKQTFQLAMISPLLPLGCAEKEVRRRYTAYALRHRRCAQYFIEQVKLTAAAMLDHEVVTELAVQDTEELIASSAILSGLSRLLAEKLILLDGKTLADGGSIEIEPMPR